ncbi:U-scoloptoxin(05)-Er1a [Chrysoperla carnea]|uniref:U-scoloptoxin(05)-Er1a n=1 Tax=Chrysoperla carnea TaxID=189513 RepID=UPI001D07CAE9|nr:U-scoloptoxin(05)-Er1a [Chrysoperla carnea]
MDISLRLSLSVLIILCSVQTAISIKCFQCSGTNSTQHPFQCNEWLSDYDMEPKSCDSVYGAKYCIKHIGRFEGGIGAKRFCSSLDLGNYCNYVKQPGDILEYRTCVFTCTGDGCNSSNHLLSTKYQYLPSIFIIILSILTVL